MARPPNPFRFWGVYQADSDGRPDRRLEDKLHCYGCGPASRFKYIMTTDRRDRLQHGRRCTHSSRVFSATHQYLEDSANRLVFHPPPTQRDLETTYRRVKWFNGLVNRGVLGEPAAEGPPAAFLWKQLVALVAIRRQMGVAQNVGTYRISIFRLVRGGSGQKKSSPRTAN